MNKQSFGDRMKTAENCFRFYLPRRCYTIIRLDMRAGHSYCKNLERPYDNILIEDMQQTALALCKEIQGAKFAFVQSDEINICVTDFDDILTEAWFDNNLQKIVSVSASIATSEFNKKRLKRSISLFDDPRFSGINLNDFTFANFDSRAYVLAERAEVLNLFLWRQRDWTSNSIQMMARSVASHKECQDKNTDQLQELIFQKSGQNWNNLEVHKRRGTSVYRKNGDWYVDKENPIFSLDWNWFDDKIPKLNT